jgi:hypothetical protein
MAENFNLSTPVAFIIFNRPETTQKVFNAIVQAKPSVLFVIADGPRNNRPREKEKCIETRSIVEKIDWDCQVFKNYSETNLGCRKRVSSGIDWVFDNVEEAIILEDDCLPHPTFFRYCQELLSRYRDVKNVMLISGDKVLSDYKVENESYYFSEYVHIWGWATWGRAWQLFDLEMKDWDRISKPNFYENHLYKKSTVKYWRKLFQEVYDGKIDTWDYQLQFAQWKNKMLSIVPANNLVINLGFGIDPTNTKGSGGLYRKMQLQGMNFPMSHPKQIISNFQADKIENNLFHKFGLKEKIRRLLLKFGIKV